MYFLGTMGPEISDYNKCLIILSVIKLSVGHCILLPSRCVKLVEHEIVENHDSTEIFQGHGKHQNRV